VSARLELAEAAAFAGMWEATGEPLLRLGGATCTAFPSAPGETMLNRAIALGVEGPVTDDDLDEIAAFFRESGAARHAISVAPDAPSDLGSRLEARAYVPGYAWMRFRRSPVDPPDVETTLRVEPATDGDAFSRVVAAGFELPAPEPGTGLGTLAGREGWHLFLAYDGDEPAGAAALFAHDGVGWFGAAATLPEHRQKGAQTALLAARIERALALGLDELTVETGEYVTDRPSASYRNILRARFSEAYVRPNWLSPE
jgi:GNAT superfamily N-acetyltransferase